MWHAICPLPHSNNQYIQLLFLIQVLVSSEPSLTTSLPSIELEPGISLLTGTFPQPYLSRYLSTVLLRIFQGNMYRQQSL